jgi:hypothetical protein
VHFAALAAVALASTPVTLRAQGTAIPVQAGATVDRDTVTVGDVVRLTVRVRAPLGAQINFPAAVDSLGPVQSIEPPTVSNGADSASAADRIAVYRLAAWDVGSQPIRLDQVLVQGDDGDRQVAIPLPTLFVRSVLPADSALRVPKPARPLLEVRAPWPWWWWLVAAASASIIGLGIWWWIRRRRGPSAPTGDPFLDAERAFEQVEQLRLVQAGEAGRHAALMTDVARRYLADRFEAASLANTSGELLAAVRAVPTVPYERLLRLLEAVDPVKFAAAPLSADRARGLGDEAKAIVREEHATAEARAAAAPKEVAA